MHFNNGFGKPVAGENMVRTGQCLGVELRTITSHWRESKDLKIAFLKASVPDMEEGTDLDITTALYGVAAKKCLSTWSLASRSGLKALPRSAGIFSIDATRRPCTSSLAPCPAALAAQ